MPVIELIHKRVGNDIRILVQLFDNDVPVNWTQVTHIFPSLFSDPQRVVMGKCHIDGLDPQDPTTLMLSYSGKSPQYRGLARLVIELRYMGHTCTVDAPAFVFVDKTADEGVGPVDVEIMSHVDPEVNSLQIVVGGGGSASWGTITGDISNQTDLMQALSGKQDTIEDFSAIEAGAAAGATAYQLPASGMPSTDMSEDVQTSLGKADTAVQPGSLKQVAFSGDYNDLSNRPAIPAAQVNSDWNAESGVAQILNKPNLATVATSGSYSDLSNKPAIPAAPGTLNTTNTEGQATSASEALSGNVSLHKVSKTGDYTDLRNKPTIPAAPVQSDWSQTDDTKLDYIKHKPNLASVAVSGSYDDLRDKPTIPTVPTISTDIETDKSSTTKTVCPKAVHDVTGSLSDLTTTAKTSLVAAINEAAQSGGGVTQVQSNWTEADSSKVDYIKNKPTLATVATSGSYNDLSNKPSIPAAQVQSDWNQSDSTKVDYIKNKPTIPSGVIVDQTYDATSTNAQSGVAMAGALSGKEDTISDLTTIRSGAEAGATAYQKPSGGIPSTDMASAVQTSLGKADTAVQPADISDMLTYSAQSLTDSQKAQARANIGADANPDREYDSDTPDGLGYKVLEKGVDFASQLTSTNTVYEIRYDYDLDDETVEIPTDCVLRFVGGSLSNGTLDLDNTYLEGDIHISCDMTGTMRNRTLYSSWINDVPLSVSNAQALGRSICVDMGATLSAPLSFFGLRDVEIRGTITNSETNYIEIGYSSTNTLPCKVDIWNATYVKMTGGKNLIVTVRNANTLVLTADSTVTGKTSIAYCTFHLGHIDNFAIVGVNEGWINENTFIKGRFITTLSIAGDDYSHSHNVFYNPTIEDGLSISLDKCQYNIFRDCRFEGTVNVTFGSTAYNNKFYRNWYTTVADLWRMFYGNKSSNGNGLFYDDSVTVKEFTIDRNSYIDGRNLAEVSLCDDDNSVRLESSGMYAYLRVTPKTDFGITMMSDSANLARLRVFFYDQSGTNITDTLTTYVNGLGTFTKATSSGGATYYYLNRDDNYAYLEVYVDRVNALLKTTYGVDGNGNPNKQVGLVTVGFAADNVRRKFNYVDFRVAFPSNDKDNAGVLMDITGATPENISSSMPTIKSSISGNSVPYSILDGETCLLTSTGVLYRRVGSSILAVSKTGFDGSYGSLTSPPTIPAVTLNGSATTSPSFYAPTGAGTNGQVLTSNGSGAPTWQNAPSGGVQDVTLGGSSVVSSGTAVLPAYPTVPTISTNIATDASSDTKTASPKAVKTYVDGVIPSVPVTDVTVGGTSVVSGGTAVIPAIPNVPVTDVTVGGTSVVSGGTAVIPAIPTVPVTDVTVGGSSVVSSGTAVIPAIPNITISSSEPTSSQGSNGDIWIVI